MAGSTPIYGLPYPQASDLVANYPALGENLAETLDEKLPTYASTAPSSPSVGQVWIDSDDNLGRVWTGSVWQLFSGASPADFSDTATGTYTDTGIDYKYVSKLATGNITFTRAGLADILLVAGGGGAAGGSNNGGGAGGLLYYAQFYIAAAATLTVTIGGGGAAGARGGNTQIGDLKVFGGGAGSATGGAVAVFGGSAGGNAGTLVPGAFGQGNANSTTNPSPGGGSGGAATGGDPGVGTALTFAGSTPFSTYTAGSFTFAVGGDNAGPVNGAANTGTGGSGTAATGGSGVVIVRVRTN
jgi:hypothetical protein